MIKIVWLSLLGCILGHTQAQEYFQQEVQYQISASLNDNDHTLESQMTVTYVNHSSETMTFLYFHLWANAYSDKSSAFAEQMLRMRNTRFYDAPMNKMGGYQSIDFTIDDQACKWEYVDHSHEIVKVQLNKPLEPGERVVLSIPSTLKIPNSFSRLGHIGTSYQMTQWYPKPAVFDRDGWHTMPYLSMGEFYSEFGSFDVSITLPDNYVVAATGTMQNKEELDFIHRKVEETQLLLPNLSKDKQKKVEFPASSSTLKTIRFAAENVHDFAWFADKRFMVVESQVSVQGASDIITRAFFTAQDAHLWADATDYINDAVLHYSNNVGSYPYPHATAVQSALSAGAGMEYPMITVIGRSNSGRSLDNVITHEVGHNWFYGILGSNERDHPWMDEGMNTYMENRYMTNKYGSDAQGMLPEFFMKSTDLSDMDLLYMMKARINADQAPETTSEKLGLLNYQISAYSKPGKIFKYLEHYLGRERFDRAMKSYYQQWKFKHPKPVDVQRAFEASTGQSLSWVFQDLLGSSKKMDYAIQKIQKGDGLDIQIVNRGDIKSPILINGLKNDSIIYSEWVDGFEGRKTLHLETVDLDEIVLDHLHLTLDACKKNNQIRTSGLFKKTNPTKLNYTGFSLNNSRINRVSVIPTMGYNANDGFMLGLGIHNIQIPFNNFEYYLLPMYGFRSNSVNGIGEIRYSWYPNKGFFNRIQVGVSGKQFDYKQNINEGIGLQYSRLRSFIDFEFGRSLSTSKAQHLRLSTTSLWVENSVYVDREFKGTEQSYQPYFTLEYTAKKEHIIHSYNIYSNLEYNNYAVPGRDDRSKYLKLNITLKGKIRYRKSKRFHYRLFAGKFLINDRRNMGVDPSGLLGRGTYGLAYQGFNDNYLFDDYFFGRNKTSGLWSRQVQIKDGGFKNALTSSSANQIGSSNDYMTAANLSIDIPKIPLVQVYMDMGYYGQSISSVVNGTFVYSGGLALKIPYVMDVYFPLFHSNNMKDAYAFAGKSKWYQQISFSFNIKDMNPDRLLKDVIYY